MFSEELPRAIREKYGSRVLQDIDSTLIGLQDSREDKPHFKINLLPTFLEPDLYPEHTVEYFAIDEYDVLRVRSSILHPATNNVIGCNWTILRVGSRRERFVHLDIKQEPGIDELFRVFFEASRVQTILLLEGAKKRTRENVSGEANDALDILRDSAHRSTKIIILSKRLIF